MGFLSGELVAVHQLSLCFAISNMPNSHITHIISVMNALGRKRRGSRLKALLPTEVRASSGRPARHWRIGFRAHTYPVTMAKTDTPMRPCVRRRMKGYWKRRGDLPASVAGRKRSPSKARVRWVRTTVKEARPRSPWCGWRVSFRVFEGIPEMEESHINPLHVLVLNTHPIWNA
jgi:hypothetical protein